MKRLVHVVAPDGGTHEVPMSAEEAAFFMRLTELKAQDDPSITFHDVVTSWIENMQRENEERRKMSTLAN